MKKKIVLIVLCFLVFSQLFATSSNWSSFNLTATLGLKENNKFGLKEVKANAEAALFKATLFPNVSYYFITDSNDYVGGKANILNIGVTVKPFKQEKLMNLSFNITSSYTDASMINSETLKVTEGPVFTIGSYANYNLLSGNAYNNFMLGTSLEFSNQKPNAQSLYGRYTLNINSKYMLTATAREDFFKEGDVTYAGFFPSLSAAYQMTQEDFGEESKINRLKLRIGYGVNGEQEKNGWGKSYQLDLGADLNALDYQIDSNADFYRIRTIEEGKERVFYGTEITAGANWEDDSYQDYNLKLMTALKYESLNSKLSPYATNVELTYGYNKDSSYLDGFVSYLDKVELEEDEQNGFKTNLTFSYRTFNKEKGISAYIRPQLVANFIKENDAYLSDVALGGNMGVSISKIKDKNINDSLSLSGLYYILDNSGVEDPVTFEITNNFFGDFTFTTLEP